MGIDCIETSYLVIFDDKDIQLENVCKLVIDFINPHHILGCIIGGNHCNGKFQLVIFNIYICKHI